MFSVRRTFLVLVVVALAAGLASQVDAAFWIGGPSAALKFNNDGTDAAVTATDGRITSVQGLAFAGGQLYIYSYTPGLTLRFDSITGSVDPTWSINDPNNKPVDLVVGPDGKFYAVVITTGVGRQIARYNSDGSFDKIFIARGASGETEAQTAKWGPDGKFYLNAAGGEKKITRWNADGSFDKVFADTGAAGMSNPTGFTFDGLGRLYVGDFTAGKAPFRFNADGSYDMTLAECGYAEQMLDWIDEKLAANPVEGITTWDPGTNTWTALQDPPYTWSHGFVVEPSGTPGPGWIKLTVTFLDFGGDKTLQPVRVQVMQNGSPVGDPITKFLDNQDAFIVDNLVAGTYSLVVSSSKCPDATVSGIQVLSGQEKAETVSLKNGDVDGDKTITSTDLSPIIKNL
jgi:hypothetical protein